MSPTDADGAGTQASNADASGVDADAGDTVAASDRDRPQRRSATRDRDSPPGESGSVGPGSINREPAAAGEHPDSSDDADPESPTTIVERRTRRWYGVGSLALLALGVGVLTGSAAALLAGVFGLAFAGYGGLTSPPEPEVAVERTIEATAPEPGDEVAVTVTVTNEGTWPLFDLRVIDGVPDRLGVTAGSPRHGAVLRAGGSTTFTYAVRARRGEHAFGRTAVAARDLAGATECVVAAGEREVLGCPPKFPGDPPAIPLRSKVSQFTGRFPGDTGGPGVEFHATRQYRRGDPLSRVDWRRTARTGEMTTVEFRVERTVRVCLVFDVRAAAHRAPAAHEPSAVERSVDAGITAYASLTAEGHDVGIATIGPTDCWLPPGSGDRHRTAARHVFATNPALSPLPHDDETDIYQATQRLKGRLPADAQVVLFAPLCDDRMLATAIRLDAYGYAVTVISPDPTTDGTTGGVYERVQRRLRIADLRARAIPVVDWAADDDLGTAIAATARRWSE